jgi:hypothetical protein
MVVPMFAARRGDADFPVLSLLRNGPLFWNVQHKFS